MARMCSGWIALTVAVLLTSSLLAVDGGKNAAVPGAKEGDLKIRMKALIGEASNSGDLWTAIMAETFATTKLGARPSGLLADCKIVGDPLFAFPNNISGFHQRGEVLVVVSGAQIFRVGMDGHPLGVAIPLKFSPSKSALSRDGRFLGVVERQYSHQQLEMSVISLLDGKEVFTATVPVAKGDYLIGSLQIAEDGSALAVSVADDDGAVCLYGVRSAGKQLTLKGFSRPVCVGAGGAWAVAEPVSNRKADVRVWTLLAQGEITLLASAAGPGLAAAIRQDDPTQVHIIQSNGTMVPLPLDLPLARKAQISSAGGYLVVSSGWPSKATSTLDLLGNPIELPAIPTTLLFRWSDLAQSTAMAKPVMTIPGCFCVGRLTGTAVFVGAGSQLAVIDVTQPNVTAAPLMTLSDDIEHLEADAGRLNVWLNHEQRVIASEEGKILFQGRVSSARLHDAWYLETRTESKAVDWVRLAENPADRQVTRLKLENPGNYWFTMDRYYRHLLATSDKKDWYDFDPLTGNLLNDSRHGKSSDLEVLDTDVAGILVSQAGRMVPRLKLPSLPTGDDATVCWNPLDAWRVGKSLVVLDRHGQVYVAPQKRGPYQMIGSVNYPESLALSDDGEMVVVDNKDKIIASVVGGPALVIKGPLIGDKSANLPDGPWRMKGYFYIPPHGKSLKWDSVKCGFTPKCLRSPVTGEMLVITASLIFEVGADFGTKVGILDRQGARDSK